MHWKVILEFSDNSVSFTAEEVLKMLGPVLQYELFPGKVALIEKTTDDFSKTETFRY